jgi:hypothetical protein
MDETLTLNPTADEAGDWQEAIRQCFVEIERLRGRMRDDQAEIEASGARTDEMLAEITEALGELKAA